MKTLQKKSRHCKSFAVTTPSFLKNIIFFLSFLLLGFGSELNAQESPKWEIGTDLLWLVGKNSLPDYSLLGRYKLSDKNALRARVGVAKSNAKNTVPRLQDKQNLLFRVGYERNKLLSDELSLYFGGDILYQYNHEYVLNPAEEYKPYYSLLYTLGQFPYPLKLVTNEMGYVAFVGIKYHLTNNLSVSMESSFNHTFQKTKVYVLPYTPMDLRSRNVNVWNLQMSPISVLNFSFHF
ncbi:hypothetical protein [Runella sp. SP2]|uniref:hypothetical protein n=1 Tax=Runella sp. SP2 TaxID=2268026 RepID=UPI000F082EE8|nr:hypothetical protein [Runella sp. SP2]AYQ34912.1 hypothetical protein DTQ70_23290 [Runella sp. SP2]